MNLVSNPARNNIVPGPHSLDFVGIDSLPATTFTVVRPVRERWFDRTNDMSRVNLWSVPDYGHDARRSLGVARVVARHGSENIPHLYNQADYYYRNLLLGFTGMTAKAWMAEMIEDEFGMFFALPGTQYDVLFLHKI